MPDDALARLFAPRSRPAALRRAGRGPAALDDAALAARVDALAAELLRLPDDALVAVRIGNRPAFVVAVLACFAARRAVVPIDPLWTEAERMYAAARVGGTVLIQAEGDVVGGPGSWLLDDTGTLLARSDPSDAAGPGRAVDDLREVAVVHWSSGTTGRPKPMAVERDALAFRITSTAAAFDIGPGDRVLAIVPLAHCHGLDCIALPTLSVGAELVLLDPLEADPARVLAAVDAHGITHLSALPRFYTHLLESPPARRDLGTLRRVLCGSAALHPERARAFAGVFGRRIRPGYGITEIGVVTLDAAPRPDRFDVVGPVLPGIDWRLQDTDAHGVGELWLRSPGQARGYLGDERATAGRFVDGWMRTHDLVSVADDGALRIEGRTSRFMNLNGAKVDPGEVEHAIERLPWVAACAVAGVAGDDGVERVVAWVEPRPGAVPTDPAGALRAGVADRLALFKLPAHVQLVDRLPRSPLGKLLYARLPEVDLGDAIDAGAAELVAEGPGTTSAGETERAVAALWCEVLGRDAVGLTTDFFACGGDSLRLAQLHEGLRDRLGAQLQLVDLFRHPTVRAQAAALSATRASPAVAEALARAARQRAARGRR